MFFDIKTTLFLTVLVTVVTGILLLFSWWQNRSHASLAWWGVANLSGALGVSLIIGRGKIPEFFSIEIANAVLFFGYGAMLCAARRFAGKPNDYWLLFGSGALWLIFCQWPAFRESIVSRVLLVSMIVTAYSWATAFVIMSGRSERLASRMPAAIWMTLHGLFYLARIPICIFGAPITEGNFISHPLIAFIALEAMIHVIAMSFLQIGMEKERAELHQRNAAQTDDLTGTANRRSVLQRADTLLAACRSRHTPAAVLAIDLDHFKAINDTFGHDAGDDILKATAKALCNVLRKTDLLGRVGGEEFICCLPDTSAREAVAVAERMRAAVSDLTVSTSLGMVAVTASIGLVSTDGTGYELLKLIKAADTALYEAKARGRDRVVDTHVAASQAVADATAAPLGAGILSVPASSSLVA